MQQNLVTLVALVLTFTILVVFHELGHFLAAKLFRMRVLEFAVGFGKRIARLYKSGETEYNIRAFPLGGFVRIAGMEVEDAAEARLTGADTDPGARIETTNERLIEQEASPVAGVDADGFNSRPLHQRFVVILAGPVFSFLLGWMVYCLLILVVGLPDKTQFRVGGVVPHKPAATAGVQAGDVILTIDGRAVDFLGALTTINKSTGVPLKLAVRGGDGHARTLTVTPRPDRQPGEKVAVGRIGVTPDVEVLTYKRVGFGESIKEGTWATGQWFAAMSRLIRSGAIKNSVGGPIAIVKSTSEAARHGSNELVEHLAQLSLSLGLMNLLPIPILDGGHLMLMLIELVRRKKLTAAQTGFVLTGGIIFIGLLSLVIAVKDIVGLFHHG